jgi:G:T-mismatch repair DNA endonuclease (very short patch repair protein)
MTDHLDKAQRSWNMSRIRGKDTPLEIVIRSNIPGLPPFLELEWK